MLILHGLEPYHWAFAGLGIAAVTIALLVLTARRLGISTGFENICSLAVKTPYLTRASLRESHGWRLPLLAGLVVGGALSAIIGGGWEPIWDLGIFDAAIGWGPVGKCVWMFVGGAFIGFGTRLAGGCTSGHGIFGLSNFEAAGLVSTVSYMVAGIVVTNVLYRFILGVV